VREHWRVKGWCRKPASHVAVYPLISGMAVPCVTTIRAVANGPVPGCRLWVVWHGSRSGKCGLGRNSW
jgi:hypothetical protein